ncbi:MAG: NADH-quinone oxidoreductase subunit M [Bacteroidia bacterium]|nr:NADH-quinone oxidoreductase subunit M [Bacteroidia bacterium]
MLTILLLLIPFLGGALALLMPENSARLTALISSTAILIVAAIISYFYLNNINAEFIGYDRVWIERLGAHFSIEVKHPIQALMVLLTSLTFPFIFVFFLNKEPKNKNIFYGLMLLAELGLLGVFISKDALLFYAFWEIALIPVYFLSSLYGGERRIPVTFKFFVYTFVGSLLMLIGIIYLYKHTGPNHSFSLYSFIEAGRTLPLETQNWLFWLMFIAFAIKMPVFPFHTWQPDTYEQSATPVTTVLSALMVKMGVFAVLFWLIPSVTLGAQEWMNVVILLSVTGIVYASILAIAQKNIKRLVAYSSIAHIGLMSAAIFSQHNLGWQGTLVQMFNHGINIMGMWFLVAILENRLQTQDMNQMGGVAKVAPKFTTALVLISMSNIALPLTSGFVGEFMMLNGLLSGASSYSVLFTVAACIAVILSAYYTLSMIRKVAYGELKENTKNFTDLSNNEMFIIGLVMFIILALGFYPQWLLNWVNIN